MTTQLLTSEIPADVTGWWASEKFDGVRAIWTGQRLISRHGRPIRCPKWFTKGLPNVRLDGELWMGRGTFDRLQSLMQAKDTETREEWREVRYMVFDLATQGDFETRCRMLSGLYGHLPNHVAVAFHAELVDSGHLDEMERNIVKDGGEGVVIRRPGCLYRPGRTGDVIKVKRLTKDVDHWQG